MVKVRQSSSSAFKLNSLHPSIHHYIHHFTLALNISNANILLAADLSNMKVIPEDSGISIYVV